MGLPVEISYEKTGFFAHSGGQQGAPGKGSFGLVRYLKNELGEQYNIPDPLIEDPEAPTYAMWKSLFNARLKL